MQPELVTSSSESSHPNGVRAHIREQDRQSGPRDRNRGSEDRIHYWSVANASTCLSMTMSSMIEFGGDEVLLKIYGPVVKKKPGLRFQLEGLRIGDHPVRMEGFGNVKEGGLRFTIRF